MAAREMMFGWKHPFTYAECAGCGSLHLLEPPPNLSDYYPADYYSLARPRPGRTGGGLRAACSAWLIRPNGFLPSRPGTALYSKYPFFHWVCICGGRLSSAILDVGCGNGGLLHRMRRWGFSDLHGVDPHCRDVVAEPGLSITQGELSSVEGRFDLIMFNHVLEHVADPAETLRQAKSRLTAGGRILVRIPIAGSHIARRYGPDWFNLDAPRHLAIPSMRGMAALAVRTGLGLLRAECETTETSFLMSERYRMGMAMNGPAPAVLEDESREFRSLARQLNRRGDGDLGVFVLAAR